MIRRLFCILAAAALLCGCDLKGRDGDWESMKWVEDQEMTEDRGVYVVPSDGATLSFHCKNYGSPWLSSGELFFRQTADGKNIGVFVQTGDWYSAVIEENRLTVTFDANNDEDRSVTILTTAGDIFYDFRFVQYAQ